MLKNILQLFLFCFSIFILGQEIDFDKTGLINREMQNYNKMTGFNLNPNTANYDLTYQRLDVTVDPAIYQIGGTVTSHFIPNQNMTSIYFDLSSQLTVSQVSFHGVNLTFQQLPTKEVKINFQNSLNANVLDSLTIHYSGAPDPANNAFQTGSQNGIAIASTLSEPFGAQDWFPTKQSMNDKIDRMDFKITTPNQFDVAGNGKLMSETALPGNKKMTFWRTQYPMAAYLAAFSITNFTKINDVIGNPPFPFVNYIYPTTTANAVVMDNIEWTKQAMTLFETYFGPYPFRNEKYGHMEFQYGGVCMEHQTMSSMSSWGKSVIAHELAHQWFGDKITCGAWNDIWLNEGFANFGEHLANEKLLMSDAQFRSYLLSQINFITSSPGGSTYVTDANLGTPGAIFNSRLSYSKGGYVLRTLKWILGDATFYQAVQDYHSRPALAYNFAKTGDLQVSVLQSTGQDFTEYFNNWIYGQGYPSYTINYDQNAVSKNIYFNVKQIQSHPSVSFFKLPLPVKVLGTNGEVQLIRLENNSNNQNFVIPCTFIVSAVEFNYDYQILEKNSTVSVNNALSTAEISNAGISLYPNPASDELFIKGLFTVEKFSIYATDGKLVKAGIFTPAKSIGINSLIPGVYILTISDQNLKFIKK